MVITVVIISWVSLYSTWTISQCLKWEMLLFLEEEIKGHITDRGRARICTAAVLSKLACCHKVDRYRWWLNFFFFALSMWKVILGQQVPWSSPHTVPWFLKHLETSLECHTVASSIFLEDRSRAASVLVSFSSQAFRCSHSSCLPHFRARINSSWWVLFRFKEGWKRCSNLGKWKCLSLVELFSSWFLTPNWKHA